MTAFMVTIYHFSEGKLIGASPQHVDAMNAIAAARMFIDTPLSEQGGVTSLAAEVKRFDGAKLVQRLMLYHA